MVKNIKAKSRGFTIVELLVVIVVIGILAAITVVSYAGITDRAKDAQSTSNAQSIKSVAETIGANVGSFPVTTGEFTSLDPNATAKVPTGITIGVAAPTAGTGQTVFQLYKLTTNSNTGGRIVYWDYGKGSLCSGGTDSCFYYGAAKSGDAFTIYAS